MSRSRIPLDLTSFVGRSTALDRLRALLSEARLVTLTGGPGMGKTRLAKEVVRRRSDSDPAPVWVELAPLRDPELLVPVLAQALDARDEVRPHDVEALTRVIGDRAVLLVLDNCEHVVEALAPVVEALFASCDGLSVLATSREALGVRGERAWLVPPLDVSAADADAEAQGEAVSLFVDRARELAPDFRLTSDTAPVVQEICRHLDGVPLAIELAAARVRLVRPREILSRLDDALGLLKDDRRTSLPRHRTLRAAIDWSHELLDEPSRTLLRRLAVFRGGFGLEAAERVGSGGAIGAREVLELVGRLVDRSLVVVRERSGFARYHLLVPLRQYARERLAEAGEESETRRRHARWVADLVEEAAPHLIGPERRVWVGRLRAEIDNLRSALEWTHRADPELHVALVGDLWWFWFSTRHWAEGRRWIDGALALEAAREPGLGRAKLLFAGGALAALQVRNADARPALEEAASLAAAYDHLQLEAYAHNYLGLSYAGEGREEAGPFLERAERWCRRHDDLYGLRLSLLLQGSSALARGDLERAERSNREGVEVARLFREPRELAVSLQNLSVVLISQGRLDEAEGMVREALAASRADQSHYFIATGVMYLGEIAGRRGDALRAARYLGAAEGLRAVVAARPFPLDANRIEGLLPELRAGVGEEAFDAARAEGRGLTLEAVLDELLESQGLETSERMASPAVPSGSPPPAGISALSGSPAPEHDASGSPLVVRALGHFRVEVGGVAVPPERWPYAKPRELLVHLLLHPAGRTRDQIGEALWPEAARANLKNSFHVTLHHLRKALGHPEWVGVEGERYRLSPAVAPVFDAAVFEADARAALASGDTAAVRAAAARYEGDLLEGETVGRWVDEPRQRLRRLFVELRLVLGGVLEDADPAGAVDVYRALAASEELDEEIHRRLMSCLVRSGDRVAAIRHYERMEALLQRALDAAPEPETRALYDRIRAG